MPLITYPRIPWLFEERSCYVAQAGLEPVMLLPEQVPPNTEITSHCHPTQLEPVCLKPFLCLPLGHRKKKKQALVGSIYKLEHNRNLSQACPLMDAPLEDSIALAREVSFPA